MTTLQEIKKENGLTNAAIAKRLGCSTSKVSMLMQGRHIRAISDDEIAQLAQALSRYYTVTFERCWLAMQESYNAWAGKPAGTIYERSDEVRCRIASEYGYPDIWPAPRSTTVESVLVVEEARRIEA